VAGNDGKCEEWAENGKAVAQTFLKNKRARWIVEWHNIGTGM